MRVFSFGGGVQSTAVLVLAVQGKVQYDAFVFANVGDDSENPATIAYLRDIARPYAETHGITIEEVRKERRDGNHLTLLQHVQKDARSLPIPVRLAPGGNPGRRSCTGEYKIKPIAKWMRQHGATADNPFVAGLGISTDEFARMRTDSGFPYQTLEYPLIDRGLSRADCLRIVAEAGLSQPPKSSCWFCPFRNLRAWKDMRREQPELFEQAAKLERLLLERGEALGRGQVYLSAALRPLDQAIGHQAAFDFDQEANCDGGYCGV